MKVKFLGVTQEVYRSTSKTNPVRILSVSRGAIVNLPDDRVRQLQKDYPKDWEVLDVPGAQVPEPVLVSEPSAEQPASSEPTTTKGEDNTWTRRKSAKK